MKTGFIIMTVSFALATIPAFAQTPERTVNARFDFAPNYFRKEQSNPPLPGALNKGVGRNGNVPKGGSAVLGLNSKLLEKPTVVQTTVAAIPSFTAPMPPANTNTPPAASFGKPKSSESPAVAQAKAGRFGKPAPAAKPSLNSDKQVSGKLLHHPMHYRVPVRGMLASPKSLDSYGNGFGYSPGPMVQPTAPGNSVSKDVYGKLLRK
jgi:hypothetical protein